MDKEIIKTKANLSYCGFQIPNVHLATNLSDFKTQFIKEYSLEDQIKESDSISLYYKLDTKKIDVKNELDYHKMLENFINSKDNVIFIETVKIPIHFDGKKSMEFEDEIKKVVERELCIAANNIKKCLTTNLTLSNCKKIRNYNCKNCDRQIIGYIYKKVSPKENDAYYCEDCSLKIDTPLFKIS